MIDVSKFEEINYIPYDQYYYWCSRVSGKVESDYISIVRRSFNPFKCVFNLIMRKGLHYYTIESGMNNMSALYSQKELRDSYNALVNEYNHRRRQEGKRIKENISIDGW